MPTTADLIGKYIELRDEIELRTKAFDVSLLPYKEAMDAISAAVTDEINRLEGQSIKTEKGTAFRQQWTAAKVADRELFMDFVFDGRREGFLTSATSKDAVKEYMEMHNGQLPPGIDFTSGYKTLFRRA